VAARGPAISLPCRRLNWPRVAWTTAAVNTGRFCLVTTTPSRLAVTSTELRALGPTATDHSRRLPNERPGVP
jgi:hypothetical protein